MTENVSPGEQTEEVYLFAPGERKVITAAVGGMIACAAVEFPINQVFFDSEIISNITTGGVVLTGFGMVTGLGVLMWRNRQQG